MDLEAWWAAVHGVATSWTRLRDFTFTFHFHALEKEMATHSSILAWRIPRTGEHGGVLSLGSHRVRHNCSDLAAAAAVTKMGCIYLCKLVFLFSFRAISRSGIDGSYGSSTFIVLRTLHTVFHSGYTSQHWVRVFFSSHPCQHLLFLVFLISAILLLLLRRFSHVQLCATP